jgi:hypothetical protein
MVCSRCGLQQPAMKTVRPRSGGASLFVCDRCYPALARWVWIVEGRFPVFGQCRGCGEWFSVRDLSDRRLGGRWNSPTGLCPACPAV